MSGISDCILCINAMLQNLSCSVSPRPSPILDWPSNPCILLWGCHLQYLIDRLSSILDRRCELDPAAGSSGMIINTFGWVDGPGYDLQRHVIQAFKVSSGHIACSNMLMTGLKRFQIMIRRPKKPHTFVPSLAPVKLNFGKHAPASRVSYRLVFVHSPD